MKHLIIVLILLITILNLNSQKFDSLALTPPMGWNSWNGFACDVNEDIIRQTADVMVSNGMKDVGYEYIIIDDCWHGKRDSLGFIHPDPKRFPSGMKALADYVHSKGLKFGIYSDAGTQTCAGRLGSQGHEYQDAIIYAKWGVDYLKYDWCNTGKRNAEEAYRTMRDALYSAGRPVILSICEWGTFQPWTWAKDIGHLWRTTGDIYHCWDCELGHGNWTSFGIVNIIDKQKGLRSYAGPDHWNDPDMMEVGNGMSFSEDRSHFSMWCMLAAPLIAGNDLRNMIKETIEILTNKEAIAINQDKLGIQGFKYLDYGDFEIWVKPLENEELAVCFLNRSDKVKKLKYDWKKIILEDALSKIYIDFKKITYNVRDIWAKKNIGTTSDILIVDIPAHDVVMLQLLKI